MKEIIKLHDLVELGIKLSKQELPNGFICTVWTKKENREKIYAELLDFDIDAVYWKVHDKNFGAYNFKILAQNFLCHFLYTLLCSRCGFLARNFNRSNVFCSFCGWVKNKFGSYENLSYICRIIK